MERPTLRIENGFNSYRQLSEKQFNVLIKNFTYDTICSFSYEEASLKIGNIIRASYRDMGDDYQEFYDGAGLPNM